MRRVLCAIAAMAIFSACCSRVESLPMENTKWNLTELQGATNELFDNPETFWFALDSQSIVGVGACNNFFGGYRLAEDGEFRVGGMGMTRMACPDMDLEDSFVRIFEAVDGFRVEGDILTLKQGDTTLAQFKGEGNFTIESEN